MLICLKNSRRGELTIFPVQNNFYRIVQNSFLASYFPLFPLITWVGCDITFAREK